MSRDKTVWTNGCFDVLHPGHVKLFKYARSLGTHLTVGIDSDRRVKELKGESRPVYSQQDRKLIIESLKYVDSVVIFDSEEELENIILCLKPDTMVVGKEYKNKKVVGHLPGIALKFFERINDYSTTKTIQNIINR